MRSRKCESALNSIFFKKNNTQGFTLAMKVFYHLSHAPSPFCFSYFSKKVLCFLPPRIGVKLSSSYLYSLVAGVTGESHHTWLIDWDGVSPTFCSCWPLSLNLISTSQVAGVTDMNHNTQRFKI
jgi:hypothetical protein